MTITNQNETQQIARDWEVGSYASFYYNRAEKEDWLETFWHPKSKFRQLFDRLNTRALVELGCGHGRHTARILNSQEYRDKVDRAYVMDVNEKNIGFCKERFRENNSIVPLVNNGYDFQLLESESVSAIFCYDAMVHFEYDAVISYIADAARILIPGGQALLHHSNYDRSPGARWSSNPGGRNFMTKNLFAHVGMRAGFKIVDQFVIDWDVSGAEGVEAKVEQLDCISLIQKREVDQIT